MQAGKPPITDAEFVVISEGRRSVTRRRQRQPEPVAEDRPRWTRLIWMAVLLVGVASLFQHH